MTRKKDRDIERRRRKKRRDEALEEVAQSKSEREK